MAAVRGAEPDPATAAELRATNRRQAWNFADLVDTHASVAEYFDGYHHERQPVSTELAETLSNSPPAPST